MQIPEVDDQKEAIWTERHSLLYAVHLIYLCSILYFISPANPSTIDNKSKINPVKIGKSVICYSNVLIKDGITIGDFSRVGGGSVVVENIPQKTFYAGVPAKLIKNRDF